MLHRYMKSSPRSTAIAAASFFAFAALVIGCGGGGGGGGTSTGTSTGTVTGTATGTVTGTATGGVFTSNVIVYSDTTDAYTSINYKQVNPDGSSKKLLYNMPTKNYQGLGLNPAVQGQTVFGYAPAGGASPVFGIYKNIGVYGGSATQLVAPVYSVITSIQISIDGAWIYYIAAIGAGNTQLYKIPITGGVPIVLDSGEINSAFVDTVDGTRITYDKYYTFLDGNNVDSIFVRPTTTSGTPVQLTTDSKANYSNPQFSKDGTKIVFVSDKDDANGEVYLMSATDGSGITKLTNNPTINKMGNGVTMSADGTKASYIGMDTVGTAFGVYTSGAVGTSNPSTLIVSDLTILPGIYWTSSNGRAVAGAARLMSRPQRRRHIQP